MKKVSKEEMKKVVGGLADESSTNTCSAQCPGGCIASVECDGQCSAYDGEGVTCNKKDGGITKINC